MTNDISEKIISFLLDHPKGYDEGELKAQKDGELFLALAREREDLVEWLPVTRGMRVLELGAGFGEHTGVFIRKGAFVDTVESDKAKARVISTRFDGEPALRVYTDAPAVLREPRSLYDIIVIYGGFSDETVLNYTVETYHESSANRRLSLLFSELSAHLSPRGRIIFITENRLGATRLSRGDAADADSAYSKTLFSRRELCAASEENGLLISFYYPVPDLYFPEYIYSDRHLPDGSDICHEPVTTDEGVVCAFRASDMLGEAAGEGLFGELCGYFCCIIEKQDALADKPDIPDYVKYSVRRNEAYRIVTELVKRKDESVSVRKRPYDEKGTAHIKRLSEVSLPLSTLYMRSGLLPAPMEAIEPDALYPYGAAEFKYAAGTPLSAILDEYLRLNDIDGFLGILDRIRTQMLSGLKDDFVSSFDESFTEVFGIGEKNAKELFAGEPCGAVCDIDLIPDNIIVDGDREWIIDWEWTFMLPVPFSFQWYRFIRYYVDMRPERQRVLGRLPYRKYDITEEKERVFCAMEEAFLLHVNSDKRPLQLELKELMPKSFYLSDVKKEQERLLSFDAYALVGRGYRRISDTAVKLTVSKGDIASRLVEIAVPADCERLRFDPASVAGVLSVEYVTDGDGRPLSYDTNCAKELSDKGMLFETDDPQIFIPIQKGVSTVRIKYGYDVLLSPADGGENRLIAAPSERSLTRSRILYALGRKAKIKENYPVIKEVRLLVSDGDVLCVYGYFPLGNEETNGIKLLLDRDEIPFERIRSPFRANTTDIPRENMIDLRAALPAGWRDKSRIAVTFEGENIFDIPVGAVDHKLLYKLDGVSSNENTEIIMGWAVARTDVEIEAKSSKGVPADSVRRVARYEINQEYGELLRDALYGFEIRLKHEAGESVYPVDITFSDDVETRHTEFLDPALNVKREASAWDKLRHYGRRSVEVLKTDGVKGVIKKARQKLSSHGADELTPYERWILQNEPDAGELLRQRDEYKTIADPPKFSVVVPLYHTKPDQLGALILALKAQTYENWELCLADASAEDGDGSELTGIVGMYGGGDKRIVYKLLPGNGGISENTNAAIDMSDGEYILFVDHDDLISANALYECYRAIKDEPETDFIYTDHDYIDEAGEQRKDPLMKPDFSPDFLNSCNYILHLHGMKRSLLEEVGYLNKEYDGAQDYDLTLRACEKAKHIVHIKKVLYHWRSSAISTADDPAAKEYVYEAGKRALEAHYARIGVDAEVIYTHRFGWYHTVYKRSDEPLVSVIIPNTDHAAQLKRCVDSVLEKEKYQNYEIKIIENNSKDAETFKLYENLCAIDGRISVETYQGSFNYSKVNNFGASKANGRYLLFLNNDTEFINGELITEMLGYFVREEVGVVGARLLYEDETIQHAGIVIGMGGTAGNAYVGLSRAKADEELWTAVSQDRSAVTGACMMTEASVFSRVGGFSEELVLAFNDVDYCLKVRRAGRLVVYDPYAVALHFESKSRGYEDTPEKKARFDHEKEMFKNRWRHIIDMGDPYYSPNLPLSPGEQSFGI